MIAYEVAGQNTQNNRFISKNTIIALVTKKCLMYTNKQKADRFHNDRETVIMKALVKKEWNRYNALLTSNPFNND